MLYELKSCLIDSKLCRSSRPTTLPEWLPEALNQGHLSWCHDSTKLPPIFHEKTSFHDYNHLYRSPWLSCQWKPSSNHSRWLVCLYIMCAPVHDVDLSKQDQWKSTNLYIVSLQSTWNAGAYKLFIPPRRLVHWVIIGHKLLRPYRQWFRICPME